MSHHIVSIDAPRCKVYVQNGQLFVATESAINSVPLEDVASIVITSFKCDIAHSVFVHAAKLKIGVVFCESYSPVSVLLPVDRATDTQLIRNLAGLSVQSKRRLWKKTVDAKCVNQFSLALKWSNDVNRLKDMENIVYSEKESKESECAKHYWAIFSEKFTGGAFKRDKKMSDYNSFFNYAYAILLSTVLRNLIALGVDPIIGVFHTTRAHSAPLAYDLMEPFRPIFDERISQWIASLDCSAETVNDSLINKEYKQYIASTLSMSFPYMDEDVSLKLLIEKVIRSFRAAVIAQKIGIYEPWKTSITKWDG